MARIRSFPPIAGPDPHTLILGTMPGVASLTAGQYYAHSRNAFWTILGRLLGFDAQLDYTARIQQLLTAGIAVWDVLQFCERRGSLDSRIQGGSVVANDFKEFFHRHPGVVRVCFNGATAQALFRRHVMPTLDDAPWRSYVRLPSTSPANAAIALSAKLDAWRAAVAPSPSVATQPRAFDNRAYPLNGSE
jgi:TDG/mug DNA glycosylase family protein